MPGGFAGHWAEARGRQRHRGVAGPSSKTAPDVGQSLDWGGGVPATLHSALWQRMEPPTMSDSWWANARRYSQHWTGHVMRQLLRVALELHNIVCLMKLTYFYIIVVKLNNKLGTCNK